MTICFVFLQGSLLLVVLPVPRGVTLKPTLQCIYMYLKKEVPQRTYYGEFRKVRQVLIDGQTLWMWPDSWKYVEPAEKREDG